MISNVLNVITSGAKAIQSNLRLLLLVALVFIFPLLFLISTQSFFETADQNVHTAQKQRVSTIHDSLKLLLENNQSNVVEFQKVLELFAVNNEDITQLDISVETTDGYRIAQSLLPEKVGTYDTDTLIYRSALGSADDSLIFEYTQNGTRQWQAVRKFQTNGETIFIVSNHNFGKFDSVMQSRKQNSYLILSLIFGFLMALAYWLAKQINWQKQHQALEKTLDERDLFVNMIAHEFRAPLTAINGYSSFLAESKTTTTDEKKYIATIQTSAVRLLDLVNDFLEVARIQSGKLDLDLEEVEAQDVIESVIETLSSTARDKNLSLNFERQALPFHIQTDSKRLTQILTNLISNSVKYTESGSVTVSLEKTPVALTIRIKDTGMGISSDDQKKLFAPFMRVGGVEKTATTGTGLGMWITKQLVEVLGGSIGIESIKGVGTHVVLTFKVRKIAS